LVLSTIANKAASPYRGGRTPNSVKIRWHTAGIEMKEGRSGTNERCFIQGIARAFVRQSDASWACCDRTHITGPEWLLQHNAGWRRGSRCAIGPRTGCNPMERLIRALRFMLVGGSSSSSSNTGGGQIRGRGMGCNARIASDRAIRVVGEVLPQELSSGGK